MGESESVNRKRWEVCVCVCENACERCEAFWAHMSRTFIGPSKFTASNIHSAIEWQGTNSYNQLQLGNHQLRLPWGYITNWNRCRWKWSVETPAPRCLHCSAFGTESESTHLYKSAMIVSTRVIVWLFDCVCSISLSCLMWLRGDPSAVM